MYYNLIASAEESTVLAQYVREEREPEFTEAEKKFKSYRSRSDTADFKHRNS